MSDVESLVVSDKLSHAASNAALEVTGKGDIAYCNWEKYFKHTFEQTVQVFDFNLFSHASKVRRGDYYEISDNVDQFKMLFESFAKTLRLLLQTGDSVVILDDPSLPVIKNKIRGNDDIVSSHQWMEQIGILDNREYISSLVPETSINNELFNKYLNSVTDHYSYDFNRGVIKDGEILAKSPETGKPAAFATSKIMNTNGKTTKVDGTLIILPQPASASKPTELMQLLVDIGWHFHEDNRTNEMQRRDSESESELAVPISALDDDLVEKCWDKYIQGEYRDAAARACQHLEHRVRQAVGEENNDRDGSSLMKHAFSADGGPISLGEQPAEREGVMHLYAGAIQGIWNPLHHRPSGEGGEKYLDNFGQQEAHDVLSYVNFLLGLLPEKDDRNDE